MAYGDYYSNCADDLDSHSCRNCGDKTTEKGRVRRGAWIHKSVIASIKAAPTNPLVWFAGIAAGKIVILPELSGTFDGGAPKYGPGYGDVKEEFLGSDFTANVKDPVYADNWAHYKSLAGKTTWHFAYCTETKVHISNVPVTVAPKNPVTENVDDDVVWDSEVKWFEEFTPAPHDIPDGVFDCSTEALEQIEFKYGSLAEGAPDSDAIEAATSGSGFSEANIVVPAGGFGNEEDAICFMAEPSTEPEKTKWYNTELKSDLLLTPVYREWLVVHR